MSTAAASPNISHLPHNPHTAHPLPLREQAFTLHCQGLRSPAIAQELGVPERTIRAWIASALDALKDDLQLNRREQLLLAVERQYQLTAVCWEQFEREAAARDALLDATLQCLHAASTGEAADRPLNVHLPASSLAPRYLNLILQANKEANRLLGLHTLARLQLLSPESDTAAARLPTAAGSAIAATCEIAAESATATDSPLLVGERLRPKPASGGCAPRAIGEGRTGPGVRSYIPAESATGPAGGLASGVQPTRSDITTSITTSPAVAATDPALPAESATASPAGTATPAKTATDPTSAPVNPAESATHATSLAANFSCRLRNPATPYTTLLCQ